MGEGVVGLILLATSEFQGNQTPELMLGSPLYYPFLVMDEQSVSSPQVSDPPGCIFQRRVDTAFLAVPPGMDR